MTTRRRLGRPGRRRLTRTIWRRRRRALPASDVTGAGDDLADASPTSVSASLGVNFGADGAGGVTAISYTGPALSSGTVLLVYTFDNATDTLTATAGAQDGVHAGRGRGGGDLDVHAARSFGSSDGSTEDNLALTFNATVTDARRRCGYSGAVGQCRRRHADGWHGRDDCC